MGRLKAPRRLNMMAFALAAALAYMFGAQAAYALDEGTYSATLAPSYENPDTGQIEDAGGESSSALGTSMVQGIALPDAAVEVDATGAAEVTVTFRQADSLGDVKVASDDSKSGSFGEDTDAKRVSEDAAQNTASYSFAASSAEATLRFKMYVEPMGRDVTFFATLGGFEPTGAPASAASAAEPASSQGAAASDSPAASQGAVAATPPADSGQDASSGEAVQADAVADLDAEASAPSGVHEYSADGNEVTGGPSAQELAGQLNYPLIAGAAAAVCAIAALVAYLAYFRPRREAQKRAAEAAAPLVEAYFSRKNGGRG